MSCAGILIAIIALAALTLAPKPSLAQSLTQQAERPGSGRASADTAAPSRGRPDELAPRFRPVVKKPHNYEPPKAAKPAKPSRPAKPAKPYKPGKHEEPDWCHPEAYCDTDEECHAMYPCKYTKCETSRRYTDKTWPKQGKCVCEANFTGDEIVAELNRRQADENAATTIMDAAVAAFGTVDLLVNSAAACFPRGDLETTTPELWDTMMHTNVKAPFLLTQAFARHVKARRARGAVVNIGSCAAHGGAPFILAYSCSKAALACFTKNTAAELRPHGIRVNQVNMGWCYTEAEDRGQRQTNENWLAEADAASPSGRILRPEDTAASVVHLLSESASMVTGAILDISPDMLPGIMSGETCC